MVVETAERNIRFLFLSEKSTLFVVSLLRPISSMFVKLMM